MNVACMQPGPGYRVSVTRQAFFESVQTLKSSGIHATFLIYKWGRVERNPDALTATRSLVLVRISIRVAF